MAALPEPHIIDRDPAAIFAEILALFEVETGHVISPDMPEYKFLRAMAQREVELRIQIREAALQNLRQYAQYPMIDLLGELVGVYRLPASPALATLRFTRTSPGVVSVPAGTRVRSDDGRVTFATFADATIDLGSDWVEVSAQAMVPGAVGNGYLAGKVKELVDGGIAATAANVDTTGGGAPQESSDALRARIPEAVHAYSTAGSAAAYRHHARAAHRAVIDVRVSALGAGVVRVVIHAAPGVPTGPLVDVVSDCLYQEDLRPLTDEIVVEAATPVTYDVTASVWLDRAAYDVVPPGLFARVEAELTDAALARAASIRSRIGADATRSRIAAVLQRDDVHTVELLLPAADVMAGDSEFAELASVAITVEGWRQ